MPRPRDPRKYPIQMEIVSQRALTLGKLEHKCATHEEALQLRFYFYDFFKACNRSELPRYQQLSEDVASLMLTVNESTLIFITRSQSNIGKQLQKTLDMLEVEREAPPKPGGKELSTEDLMEDLVRGLK